MVEHLLCKQGVRGSTPLVSTMEKDPSEMADLFSLTSDMAAISVSENYVVLMLCSMYATDMSRNSEDPVFNQIEAARTSMGLSRQELADLVGVHYQTIGYLERGEYSPSLVLALRISRALKQEVSELFSLTPRSEGK